VTPASDPFKRLLIMRFADDFISEKRVAFDGRKAGQERGMALR
jgi:hypothetical protein